MFLGTLKKQLIMMIVIDDMINLYLIHRHYILLYHLNTSLQIYYFLDIVEYLTYLLHYATSVFF